MSLSAQAIFDRVVEHAAQMPGRSHVDGKGCLYRGPNGNKCFVGALLTDEEAKGLDASMPYTAAELAGANLMPERLLEHAALLQSLQDVHDQSRTMTSWPVELRLVAGRYGLDPSSVTRCFPGA